MDPEKTESKPHIVDEEKEPVYYLLRHRLPWLTLGLLGGMTASVVLSRFETILSKDIRLAFFIPIIVYMSDAVGTQTETIFIRGLAKKKPKIVIYLLKEIVVGLGLGLCFGVAISIFSSIWLHSLEIGLTVGLAMFISVASAPVLALLIPALLAKERIDPAFGAGPLATIIQDIISLLIYFSISALIIF